MNISVRDLRFIMTVTVIPMMVMIPMMMFIRSMLLRSTTVTSLIRPCTALITFMMLMMMMISTNYFRTTF